ncbi:hypothetical protein I7I48_10714 [Histoplasma ohiense]|nr:hypothetical protein I7I48_10714 [Histoplasma ohiense (nom. inval.)]
MHRERQQYSAEWQKMMPTSITTDDHRHHNASLFADDDHQCYESLQDLSEKVLLSSFFSRQEHGASNHKPPNINCCSSSSISSKNPLAHSSHFCPVQAIDDLISSLSRDLSRARSCTLVPSVASTGISSSSSSSSVIRPKQPRRARNKTISGRLTSPSSEWLNLTSSRQIIAPFSQVATNPRSFVVLRRQASRKGADTRVCSSTMADPSAAVGAHPAIGSSPKPTVTALAGGAADGIPDVTVNAFGTTYSLHRSILERSPYFSAMLSGQWSENSESGISIFPDEMDPNITKVGFEVALEYMYGRNVMDLIELDPIGIFASCQWLEFPELLKWAAQNIMHHLNVSNIHLIIHIFSESYYGKEGMVILDAAKALLRLRGCEMPLAVWDHIPAELVREIIGGDTFYMPSELNRWEYAVSLLDRILEMKASKMRVPFLDDKASAPAHVKRQLEGLLPDDPPETDNNTDLDTSAEGDLETARQFPEDIHNQWLDLYTHPDILPIRQMIMEDIGYMHIPLQHFRRIQAHHDIFGVRPVQQAVIHSAFVQALKLAHLVDSADEFSPKLNIRKDMLMSDFPASQRIQIHRFHKDSDLYPCAMSGGDAIPHEYPITKEDKMSANLVVSRKARGLIHEDCNYHVPQHGFIAAQFVTGWERSDFIKPLPMNLPDPHPEYSPFPPFRFSTSFPHPATLDSKQRCFSPPFWYAGSTWVLYLYYNTIPKASRVGLYLRRIYDTRRAEPSLDSWCSRLNPPRMAHHDPLCCYRVLPDLHPSDLSSCYNEAYPRLDLLGDRFGTRNGMGQLYPRIGRPNDILAKLPYVDIRSAVTVHFKLYSNFACAGQPACFQSKPEQFQIDRCWGWDVRVPDGQEPLLDLCGNPLNERQLKICLVIGVL